jgi:hypothetical protein
MIVRPWVWEARGKCAELERVMAATSVRLECKVRRCRLTHLNPR